MHKILRDALPNARGHSDQVIVVIADIRGFSAFCLNQETPDVAMYLRRVYLRLIDDYFPFASFYKSTGDGLLLTISFDEDNLARVAQETIAACLRCLEEFPTICERDPVINFDVPTNIGFGLTRGTACRLVSDKKVLDYSGRILNLASRLTDLARPSGIVLDGAFGIELLTKKEQKLFERDQIYVRSVSEEELWPIYVLSGVVEIPQQARHPLSLEQWETLSVKETVRRWKDIGPRFIVDLPKRLKRSGGILVSVVYPAFEGDRRLRGIESTLDMVRGNDFDYRIVANVPGVRIYVEKMLGYLPPRIPETAYVNVVISYVPE